MCTGRDRALGERMPVGGERRPVSDCRRQKSRISGGMLDLRSSAKRGVRGISSTRSASVRAITRTGCPEATDLRSLGARARSRRELHGAPSGSFPSGAPRLGEACARSTSRVRKDRARGSRPEVRISGDRKRGDHRAKPAAVSATTTLWRISAARPTVAVVAATDDGRSTCTLPGRGLETHALGLGPAPRWPGSRARQRHARSGGAPGAACSRLERGELADAPSLCRAASGRSHCPAAGGPAVAPPPAIPH